MRTLSIDDADTLALAANALLAGEVVVVPTDTVYGLAAIPDDPAAVGKIFLAKDRPADVHLPVLAGSLTQVTELGVHLTDAGTTLANRWWPGPLTLALGFAGESARPAWLAERDEVAVRIPAHPFLLALLEVTGVLLVTSANQHGSGTPPTAGDAAGSLAAHVGLIVDGGTLASSPSTLVNVRSIPPVVEREGAISRDDIAAALEPVR